MEFVISLVLSLLQNPASSFCQILYRGLANLSTYIPLEFLVWVPHSPPPPRPAPKPWCGKGAERLIVENEALFKVQTATAL